MDAREVAVVFGTRPEVVKLAPVLWALGPETLTIHTGQHPLDALTPGLTDLGLDLPTVTGSVTPQPRGRQLGEAVAAVTEALAARRPRIVVVQGDTNSTVAGALAATSLDLPLVHVEAGLRSFDRAMPEERNRVVVDHLADVLCAPTETARDHLLAEGIPPHRITRTGNTVVDAARRVLPASGHRLPLLREYAVDSAAFILATFHRPENVDDPDRLAAIVAELQACPLPVLLPLHPRTRDRARATGVGLDGGALTTIDPLGYRDFLALLAECAVAITDSGGVQEEVSVLGRPAIVVRNSTERPEVLDTFSTLIGVGPEIGRATRAVVDDLDAIHDRLAATPTPYGDGEAGRRTVDAIRSHLEGGVTDDSDREDRYDSTRGRHDGSAAAR